VSSKFPVTVTALGVNPTAVSPVSILLDASVRNFTGSTLVTAVDPAVYSLYVTPPGSAETKTCVYTPVPLGKPMSTLIVVGVISISSSFVSYAGLLVFGYAITVEASLLQ